MTLPGFRPLSSPGPKPDATNYDANAAPNLAAGWVAEGGAVKDVVGDLDVALQGVTITASPYGSALNFAGGGVVALGVLALAEPCTLFVLMQYGTQPGGWILHRGEADGIGWQVTDSTAFAAATVGNAVHGNLITFSQGATEWFATALVLDGGKGRLYVNSQLVREFDSTALSGSGAWQFGDGSFAGAIADARIYQRALPVVELQTIQGGGFQWSAYRGRPSDAAPGGNERAHWRKIDGYGRRTSRLKTRIARRL